MSIERMSPPATKWIKENPIKYDADGKNPVGKRFFSTRSVFDTKEHPGPQYRDTFLPFPEGLSTDMQRFTLDLFEHNIVEKLTITQLGYFFRFVSQNTTVRNISLDRGVGYTSVNDSLKTGIRKGFRLLPPEKKATYVLDNLLKLSRGEASTRRERKPTQKIDTFSDAGRQDSIRANVKRSRDAQASKRQYKVGITNLPESEAQRIRKEREVAFKIEDSKLRQLLEGAYDMTKEEREAKPMKGTLFNWVFSQTLPEDLIQFYVDHPDLEVDRWKKFSTNPYDSFVSFAYGQVCYTVYGDRAFMYASSIAEHFRRDNQHGDPAAFKKFAMLRWPEIQRDIEMAAFLKGYRPPAAKAS